MGKKKIVGKKTLKLKAKKVHNKVIGKKTGLKLKVHKKKIALKKKILKKKIALKKKIHKKKIVAKKTHLKMHLKAHKQKVAGAIVIKGTRPAKHSKVTKITKHVGDVITTSVYTVQEVITETIVTVEEILTVQMHRLGSIRTVISDTSARIKKSKGSKKIKLVKKLAAAKKNIKD